MKENELVSFDRATSSFFVGVTGCVTDAAFVTGCVTDAGFGVTTAVDADALFDAPDFF